MLFLRIEEILILHAALIDKFGGIHGLRDPAGLEAALAAPQMRAHYEEADLVVCAATSAFHFTNAHAFLDGNKRVAAAATELFVRLNYGRVEASDAQVIMHFLAIAAGKLTRDQVEIAFREWITPPAGSAP